MPLTEDDVREILRLIDESPVEEIRAETGRFTLYALRGGRASRRSRRGPTAARAADRHRRHDDA